MTESFWAMEKSKIATSQENQDLADTYGIIDFGKRLEFVTRLGPLDKQEEIVVRAFLNHHYGANIMQSSRWLLKRVAISFLLRHKETKKIVAFVACLEVPVITLPSVRTEKVLLATMLCVATQLRTTGLVKKFLAASIQSTLQHGYKTRMFTTTETLGIDAAAKCTRYTFGPTSSDWPKTIKTARSLEDVYKNIPTTLSHCIGWHYIIKQQHLDVAAVCAKLEDGKLWALALLLRQNSNEYQILSFHTDFPDDPLVLPWLATHLKSTILYDQNDNAKNKINVEKGDFTTTYNVYLHNMSADGDWNVPMV